MRLDDTAKNKTEKCVLIIGAFYLSMVFNFMLIYLFLKKCTVLINFSFIQQVSRLLHVSQFQKKTSKNILSINFFHFGTDAAISDKDSVLVPSKCIVHLNYIMYYFPICVNKGGHFF